MNENLPALSLRQPWLYAILFSGKNIENRTWSTRYRGRLRLHASKTYDSDGADWLRARGFNCPGLLAARNAGLLGAYLGEVTLVDCLPFDVGTAPEDGPHRWAFGPVCWVLRDPVAYREPIPGRGYPGLYWPERFEKRAR
jgi:hypothetical protein